jgi:hypothetical protein
MMNVVDQAAKGTHPTPLMRLSRRRPAATYGSLSDPLLLPLLAWHLLLLLLLLTGRLVKARLLPEASPAKGCKWPGTCGSVAVDGWGSLVRRPLLLMPCAACWWRLLLPAKPPFTWETRSIMQAVLKGKKKGLLSSADPTGRSSESSKQRR